MQHQPRLRFLKVTESAVIAYFNYFHLLLLDSQNSMFNYTHCEHKPMVDSLGEHRFVFHCQLSSICPHKTILGPCR